MARGARHLADRTGGCAGSSQHARHRQPGRRPAASGHAALQFPKWTDGRAYTQARLLRTRYRYRGEVRATGDVLVDMLPLLQRTGFDAVCMRHGQRLESAMRALGYFAGHYQGDVTQPLPVFARDLAVDLARQRERAQQSVGEGI